MATIAQLQAERARLNLELSALGKRYENGETNLLPLIQATANQLANVVVELELQMFGQSASPANLAPEDGPRPVASSGIVVAQDAQAKEPDASVVAPAPPPPEQIDANGVIANRANVQPTNAQQLNQNPPPTDSGTNAETKPLVSTQSTGGGSILTDQEPGWTSARPVTKTGDDANPANVVPVINVGGSPGVGSRTDDAAQVNQTKQAVDAAYGDVNIVPQSNVLDQYASYTYNASLYLCNKATYDQFMQSKQKNLGGAQLLISSGGIPVTQRNQYFSDDYYIDRISLKSQITGRGTNSVHNVSTIDLTVIEPNGITLINNLDQAVQAYLGVQDKKKNFAAQLYLLVIRFYGYDEQGNLVRGGVPKPDGSSDPNAFVEKWYPVTINSINYRVANKLVEYNINCSSPSYSQSYGTSRGTIPYNIEMSGKTVKDVLNGPAVYAVAPTTSTPATSSTVYYENDGTSSTSVAPAPEKASTAPTTKTTIKQGLFAALNDFQAQLVADGTYTYPDRYSIEFVNPEIANSSIKNRGTNTDKSKMANSKPVNAADAKNPNRQSSDPTAKIASITAGTQIVQVLDTIIRNSTFLEDQQTVIIDPKTQKELPNGAAAKNLAYFKISSEVKPIAYDPKRNDWAYDIKYKVSFYKINESLSTYFYAPTYRGVHKQYNYWFTGENTQVLNYEQNYNSQYTSVLSGGVSNSLSILTDRVKFNFSPRSNQSSQGAKGKVNEPKANLASYLFDPSDLANATLTIVGDPAWLQQGEAFAGIKSNDSSYFRPFLADGTINFDSQQILFEILINAPADYDLETGLIDPNQQTTFFANGRQPGGARQSYIYIANECISEFNQGKFTQVLKGSLLDYLPDQSFKFNQSSNDLLQLSILTALSNTRTPLSSQIAGFSSVALQSLLGSFANKASNSPAYQNILAALASSPGQPSLSTARPAAPVTSNGQTVGAAATSVINGPDQSSPSSATTNAPQPVVAPGDDAGSDSSAGTLTDNNIYI